MDSSINPWYTSTVCSSLRIATAEYELCGGPLSTIGRYEIFINDFVNPKCLCCSVLLSVEIKFLFWSILKLYFCNNSLPISSHRYIQP